MSTHPAGPTVQAMRGKPRVALQDRGQLGGGLALPAGPVGLGDLQRAVTSVTSCPVNQPAFSSAARASSAVR